MAKQPDRPVGMNSESDSVPLGATRQDSPEELAALAAKKAQQSKRDNQMPEAGLTITSLMDIMTIQLVFLLVSMTSDPLNVTVNSSMQLAMSSAENAPKTDSIPVIVTKEHILVDSKAVADLTCTIDKDPCDAAVFQKINLCEINPEDPNLDGVCSKTFSLAVDKQHKERSDATSLVIQPLLEALNLAVENQVRENEQLGRKFKGTVTLVVDKEVPFRVLMEVIYTAGKAHFNDQGLSRFRLAIARNL